MILFGNDVPDPASKRAEIRTVRKLALCGSHSDSLHDAPWDDPSWKFMGHASSRLYYKRPMDFYIDLHPPAVWTRGGKKGNAYPRWLGKNTTPIYMQERYPDVPASIRFPKGKILTEFSDCRPYFTNHVAWMIALAMTEGVEVIGLFGINYGIESEYMRQRGSAEFWIGRAVERGIRIVLPKQCTLLAEPGLLYGYESHDLETGKLRDEYKVKKFNSIVPVSEKTGPAKRMEFPKSIAEEFKEQEEDNERPAWAFRPLPTNRTDGDASVPA